MNLKSLKTKFPKVHLITHTDLDGYASAAIMIKLLHERLGYALDNIQVDHVSPSDQFPILGDNLSSFVIVTDLSCSNARNVQTFQFFQQEMEAKSDNILLWWFDHHQTSVDTIKEHPELGKIPGIVNTEVCGAMLCWIFYQFAWLLTEPDVDTDIEELYTLIRPLSSNLHTIKYAEDCPEEDINVMSGPWLLPEFAKTAGVPRTSRALICTDDWDRFQLQDPYSSNLDMAFETCPDFPKDPKSKYWQDYFFHAKDHVDRANASVLFQEFIQFGAAATHWFNYNWLVELKRNGFIANLDLAKLISDYRQDPQYAYKLSTIDFVCCPRADANFHMAAGPVADVKNWGLLYTDHGHSQTLTVFCRNPEETRAKIGLDARLVCQALGGGGHPGCAGARVIRVPFSNVRPLDEETLKLIDELIAQEGSQLTPALSPMCKQWI